MRTHTFWMDAAGYDEIGKDGITAIESVRAGRQVNVDLGMPARLIGAVEETAVSRQIYHLLKHDYYMALKPILEEI